MNYNIKMKGTVWEKERDYKHILGIDISKINEKERERIISNM